MIVLFSFGEEGMQLVQSSKFFSVTIFRTRSIGSVGKRACELGLLLFLKNFELLCMPSSPKEYISP